MDKKLAVLPLLALLIVTGCINTAEKEKDQIETGEQTGSNEVREFNMVARQWEFEPSTITVSKGEKVRLNIKSIDVTHGISLSAFGINSVLNSGETTTIEFTADQSGIFPYICSVQCGSGHFGMRGKLIVQ